MGDSKFIVTEKAMRPATDARECFYCNRPIGEAHKADCVLVSKRVKVRMTVEYFVEVPSDWDKHQIEFQRNGGSWCSQNAIAELEELVEGGDCLCGRMEFEYLGEDSDPYLSER
jgi:hypothetical protein